MRARLLTTAAASSCVRASIGGLSLLLAFSCEDGGEGGDSVDADANPSADAGASTEAGDGASDAEDAIPPPYDFEVACTVTPCVTRIAARGGAHACAILSDHSARCWGANATGQLGVGGGGDAGSAPAYEAAPRPVIGITNARSIIASGEGSSGTTCVINAEGEVSCFGSDAWGQIGGAQPSPAPVRVPAPIAGVRAKSLTLANTFVLAVGTDDRLWSWGANDARQLARTTSEPDAAVTGSPAEADRVLGPVVGCAGTSKTAYAVTKSGELLSWGGESGEELGRTTSVSRDPIPAAIDLPSVASVATGAAHACALSRGRVFCWGRNEQGQLGTGRRADEQLPAPIILPADVYAVAVYAGASTACLITGSGDVYCWGAIQSSELGEATPLGQALPRKIEGLEGPAVDVGVMDDAICVLLRSGAIACWGDNLMGQLGRGTRDLDEHARPEPVVFE